MDSKKRFDKLVEEHQISWRLKNKLLEGQLGLFYGKPREHILPDEQWLQGVWQLIRDSLTTYLDVSGIQPSSQKNNLKSSWVQSANLFFPFRWHPHMKRMLASFLSRQLNLTVTSIEAVEFEYAAPGNLEPKRLLGEQGGSRGSGQTSPDVAVIFGCDDGKSGLYLIENKYTEHHFYKCSGADANPTQGHISMGLQPNDNPARCRNVMGVYSNPDAMCHQQEWRRKYWGLLKDSINEETLKACGVCPALTDGYQLFRQQAYAQGIADSGLFDLVVSGVAYDKRNKTLVSCLKSVRINDFASDWSRLFNTSVRFHCFTHQELVSWTTRSRSGFIKEWGQYVKNRYDYK